MTLSRVPTATTAQTVAAVEKMMNAMERDEAVCFARIIAAEGMRATRELEHEELAKIFDARADALARDVARSAIAKSARGESIEAEEAAWAALSLISKERSAEDEAHYRRNLRGQFSVTEADLGQRMNGLGPWTPKTYREQAAIPFVQGWTPAKDAQFQPGRTAFDRLAAGADLMQSTFGPTLPPQAQLASEAARYVGYIGPYAAQVVVPAADLTAARYRGIERHEVDPELGRALRENASAVREDAAAANGESDAHQAYQRSLHNSQARFERRAEEVRLAAGRGPGRKLEPEPPYLDTSSELLTRDELARRNASNQARENIRRENRARAAEAGMSPAAARAALRDARAKLAAENIAHRAKLIADVGEARARTGAESLRNMGARRGRLVHGFTELDTGDWNPGPVLGYWRNRLPSADMNTLQVRSGTVPPSQGMIMDREGKITSQAAGYGDDWFTPFPLKQLSSLKGGEYVRTRTFGGPTTEDIYTGLVHRARAVTVVSHSGSFTIEFDDSLTGGRRFNDKALRMTDRYGALLDAVRSGQIRIASLDPAMDEQLAATAAATYPPSVDRTGYDRELARLQAGLRANPRLSERKRAELAEAWLTAKAADTTHAKTADASLEQVLDRGVKLRAAAMSAEQATRTEAEGFGAPSPAERTETAARIEANLRAQLAPGGVPDYLAMADVLNWRPQLEGYLHAQAIETVKGSDALILNGRGYKAAMDALAEQFPYYIKRVEWHPWKPNAAGPRDTGYVRPGRNRPAAAQAGYFGNENVAGVGAKVAADSTRWQERVVRAADTAPGQRVQAQSAPGSAATSPVAESERSQQRVRKASADYFEWLRAQTKFGPEADDPNGLSIKNSEINPNDANDVPPPLRELWSAEPEQFKTKLLAGDPAAEGVLRRVHSYASAHKLFGDAEPAARYARGGLAADAASRAKDWHEFLDKKNFTNWPGPAFNGSADPETITQVYQSRPEITGLIESGKLAASPDWDTVADTQAQILEEGLRMRDAKVAGWDASGESIYRDAIAEADAEMKIQATGLAMARTLANSYRDASARLAEQARQRAEAAPNVSYQGMVFDQDSGQFRTLTPEQTRDAVDLGQLPGNGP